MHLANAQSHLKAAEATLKANTEAQGRAKTPEDQKLLRSYVTTSQARVSEARSVVVTMQREVDAIKAKIVVIKKAEAAPELDLNAGTQNSAAAPVKPAAPKALQVVVMKDGRRIECLRFMEVEEEYALQMPDKKYQNVKKADVAEIVSP